MIRWSQSERESLAERLSAPALSAVETVPEPLSLRHLLMGDVAEGLAHCSKGLTRWRTLMPRAWA